MHAGRDHVLSKRGLKRWPPGYFPGQTPCYCCQSSSYHIRQYENDSGMAVLAQQSDNLKARGLWWDGTELTAIYTATTTPETRCIVYDSSLGSVRTITHTYPAQDILNPAMMQCVHPCADGTYAMTATRTTATSTRSAAASINSDNSLDWETNVDTYTGGGVGLTTDAVCVVSDSSGNVYVACTNGDTSGEGYLYKFNNAGTKQWKTSIGTGGFRPRQISIASDGYIWVSGSNAKIIRVSTAGTVSLTVSQSFGDDNQGSLWADQSNGIWTGVWNGTGLAATIRNYDSSGSLVTTITESTLNIGAPPTLRSRFAVDSSDNVYGLTRTGGVFKVKKWDSGGSVQWTSGDVGWTAATAATGAHVIAVDDDYIFVGGDQYT